MTLSRRTLLLGMASSALACHRDPACEVAFVGQSPARGHALRDGQLRIDKGVKPTRCGVLIVGAGVSGASAVWRLHKAGFDDVQLLELEDEVGGTARGGTTPRSAYPMGAHYLPSPHLGFVGLLELLRDLGVVLGRDAAGRPDYDPTVVCPSVVERHRYRGRWAGGLYPGDGQTPSEAEQWARWQQHLLDLDDRRGPDGRRLFDLPVAHSSTAMRQLDRISMAQYLAQQGITSWRVRWLVDYSCRDDYGCSIEQTSAFAGLHHDLCRGLEDKHERVVLAWPQGNQALIDLMLAKAHLDPARLHRGHAVVRIDADHGRVWALDVATGQTRAFEATAIVWAAPRFILPHVLGGQDPLPRTALSYAPWMVANVETGATPGGVGAPLAWDNVDVGADHLGYVVANHNESRTKRTREGVVMSFYAPLIGDPATQRKRLLSTTLGQWDTQVRQTIASMHPGWDPKLRRIHIARWGHGMIRPVPGLLFGADLERARAPIGRVHPCAADVGGLALFEQSFCLAVESAEQILRDLGRTPTSLITYNRA